MLVILDNFEQVAMFAEETLGWWLGASTGASFLATSRERLRLPGEIVYSPGFFVNEGAIAYVRAHPLDSINVDVNLSAGVSLPGDVELVVLPEYPVYSYAYVNGMPVIVDADSRLILWVAA